MNLTSPGHASPEILQTRKAPKFRIGGLILLFVALLAAFGVWLFRSPHSASPTGAPDHRLTELREPFRNISIVHYARANKIGVEIFDATSFSREFDIQYAPNARHAAPVIIVEDSSSPRVELGNLASNDAATRAALLDILNRYGRGQREVDEAIALLTDKPADHLRNRYDAVRDSIRDLLSLLTDGEHGS